jgi:lactate dehydrogenase-like 2-hydroxyacid dehydrogenase
MLGASETAATTANLLFAGQADAARALETSAASLLALQLIGAGITSRRSIISIPSANHILLRMKDVIITPHSAFNTREAVQRILDTTHENIVAFARGEPLNIVN